MHQEFAHMLQLDSAPKYPSGLACMQPNLNLGKLTASHFQVLNTQNENKNMSNMFPIVYLNENLRYCNENFPTCFGTQQKVRKWQKLHFTLLSCRYHNF